MYGLIFENFSGYLKHKYGEEAWDQIRRLANLDSPTFSIHQASFRSCDSHFGPSMNDIRKNLGIVYPSPPCHMYRVHATSLIRLS